MNGLLGKINVQMLSPFGDKENFDACYINAEELLDSETRLSTAQAVDSYGKALASLSKSTFNKVTVGCEIPINSETAVSSSLPSDTHIIGSLSFNLSDLSYGEPTNDYDKATGMKADITPLFNSETQITFLEQMDGLGNGYCSLSSDKQFNSAKISGYKFDIEEIVAEE